MKTFQWPLRAFLLVVLLQIVSCTKTTDSTTHSINASQFSDLTFPVTNEFANCKLRNVRLKHPEVEQYINGVFTYNSAGNPVSLIFKDAIEGEDAAIYPGYYFTYKQGRLSSLHHRTVYDNDAWHSYAYDATNRIIADTAEYGFSYYPPTGPQRSVYQIFISTFTYDAQGRIIKETIKNTLNNDGDGGVSPLQPTRNPTFTYDARGNLAVAGWKSSSYDNKVSIFRSHPILQFIARNYSKNNSSVQSRYNSKGLPLSVTPGNDQFFDYYKAVDRALYDCQ